MAHKRTNKKFSTYETLASRLKDRGTNFRRFAIARGYAFQTVYSAARGERDGIVTRKIRRELEALAA